MTDRKIVDLTQRRAEGDRQRRKAAFARFKPASSMIAWVVLLAVAVLGYLWSGASTRFHKAAPSGVTD